MKIMVTGGAGFIAFHLIKSLVAAGHEVYGVDSFNDYYDVNLKYDRADKLKDECGVYVHYANLCDMPALSSLFDDTPDAVIHLGAYAGVRHSLTHPDKYIQNNIVGTQNLINCCELFGVENVIYASTSCVMSGNELPWKEDAPTFHQLNPYGYSKRTNECQFITSKIRNTIGLRFFTVYGPWGRPDMALFTFADAIANNKPIDVFNFGDMKRDFTYVTDIVQGINIVLDRIFSVDTHINEIYNIGFGQQVNLMDFIEEIELNLGVRVKKNFLPKHPADTKETWSDTTKLQALGYKPTTSIKEGVREFCNWYRWYKKEN